MGSCGGSTWVGSGFAHKYYSNLEEAVSEKHSSLLEHIIYNGCKKFLPQNLDGIPT
jgi:hypothetical protein